MLRLISYQPERTSKALIKEYAYPAEPTTHGLIDKFFELGDLADEDTGAAVGVFE